MKSRLVHKRGHALLQDPLLNKGSAFTEVERRELGLEGLLPHRAVTMDVQRQRILANLERITVPLDRYVFLAALHDRNEYLFFDVLTARLDELLPIVYTPTVGLATQQFSQVFQRGRGVWITPAMRGRVAEALRNAADGREVRLIVATDNESILGIGDQGAGGMAISIGKLALYTAGAGIDPESVLPVSLDVGTDNVALRDNPLYLGWAAPRLRGKDYIELIDEFVAAVKGVFPAALVQWEDFRKDNALRVLDRHRHRLLSFNDDIQGTGAIALAGVLCSARLTGRPLAEERIVIHGGGAAGLGIARQIRAGLTAAGVTAEAAANAVAVLDSKGLLVDDGTLADGYKKELAWPASWAARRGLAAGRPLEAVVRGFRPTVLIGTSGQPGAFNEEVIRTMAGAVDRPVVLPLSNPTDQCEAAPADVYAWSAGRAIVATGSPFPDVAYGGRRWRVGQGNNAFIFPAVGLAALAGRFGEVTETMFLEAARQLAAAVSAEELERGLIYPATTRLRDISIATAKALVARFGDFPSRQAAEAAVDAQVWSPVYPDYRTGADGG